jgi:molecular chaperone GrpE
MQNKNKKDNEIIEEGIADETLEDEMQEEELDEELAAIESFEQGADEDDSLIAALKREKEEYVNLLKRERADFENYRKRNAEIAAGSYTNGVADTIKSVLPVIDNLERALASNCSDNALTEGIQMIQRQFMDTLCNFGLEEINAQGEPFDPECMNAVMQAECAEGQDPNCVAEVFQKGYRLKGKVLRCAMVKVSN